ncbi:MAG: galactokinase [Pseudomonadales bacterium]
MSRKEMVKELFLESFAYEAEEIFHGPGRVNLIGDHTDYNDGFVLPAAINFGTDIAASLRQDNTVRVLALDCNSETAEFSLDQISFDEEKMWVNYVSGTLQALMKDYPHIKGVDMVVSGDVPIGAGLSSSASLEIAILKAAAHLNKLPLEGIQAALMGQAAENNFVGCNCGIMDQLISAMGKDGHAMLLDCRSLTFEDVPVPADLEIVIVNSNVKRGLVDSEYNTRREQCEAVAKIFNRKALRDITMEELEANKGQLDEVAFRRARHVITENERAQATLEALLSNDIISLSRLMKASHYSLKNDFEVSTKELDGLVTIIDGVVGEEGGARMTGGGFGGCVVALVPKDKVTEVFDAVSSRYPEQFGLLPDIYVCSTAAGAFRE